MKPLAFLISLIVPGILYSASPLDWQWTATAEDASCSYKLVRTATPEGMESPDYSILVVYSWEFEQSCNTGVDTVERAQVEAWSSELTRALAETDVGFSVATVVEPARIENVFYVCDLNAFRTLSLKAGELSVDTGVSYEFSRDLDWDAWRALRDEPSQPIQFVLNHPEEE